MLGEKQKAYHRRRARQELDMAYRAEGETIASAHMKLSALHMRRIAELDGSTGRSSDEAGQAFGPIAS